VCVRLVTAPVGVKGGEGVSLLLRGRGNIGVALTAEWRSVGGGGWVVVLCVLVGGLVGWGPGEGFMRGGVGGGGEGVGERGCLVGRGWGVVGLE